MNLYISDDKKKGLPVVFLHGNSISHKVFEGLAKLNYTESLRHILVDLPGHGFSPRLPAYTLRNMAEVVCTFVNQTLHEDYFIVAHSLSGHLVLNGMTQLKRIRGLILVGTPPLKEIDDMAEAFNQTTSSLLHKGNWNETEIQEISLQYSNTKPGIIREALLQCDSKFKFDFLQPEFTKGFANEHHIIRTAEFPVALTWSSNDTFVNPEYLKKSSETFGNPYATFHEFEFGGHSPFMDKPDIFYQYINSFIYNAL